MTTFPRQPGTIVDCRRPDTDTGDGLIDCGVIIHAAVTWLLAYFPGEPHQLIDPLDLSSVRVVATAEVITYRDLSDADPLWVLRTWRQLAHVGTGFLGAPQVVRVWKLAARFAAYQLDTEAARLITGEHRAHRAPDPVTDTVSARPEQMIAAPTLRETCPTSAAARDEPAGHDEAATP